MKTQYKYANIYWCLHILNQGHTSSSPYIIENWDTAKVDHLIFFTHLGLKTVKDETMQLKII